MAIGSLNLKLVCIIEAIVLAAALFLDSTFAPCPFYTMKLAFKLDLKTNKIQNGIVKKRIETIWANRTVTLLDRFFKNHPEWWIAIIIIYTQLATKSRDLRRWFQFVKNICR